jgi:hypothetical protein
MTPINLRCSCVDPRVAQLDDVFQETDNERFLRATLGRQPKVVYRSYDAPHTMQSLPQFETDDDSLAPNLLLHAMHQAQLAHAAVKLTPDVIWYCLVHQFAEQRHIRGVHDYAGGLKENLRVHPLMTPRLPHQFEEIDWPATLDMMYRELLHRLPGEVLWDVTPRFSGMTTAVDIATIAALLSGPNPHRPYQPQTGTSHIAQVNIGGVPSDWHTLHRRLQSIDPRLDWEYRRHARQVLEAFVRTTAGASMGKEFWEKIYFSTSDGFVGGWITALFGHDYRGDKPVTHSHEDEDHGRPANSFPSLVSTVPLIVQADGGRDKRYLKLLAGVTSVENSDNALKPSLGFTVIED